MALKCDLRLAGSLTLGGPAELYNHVATTQLTTLSVTQPPPPTEFIISAKDPSSSSHP